MLKEREQLKKAKQTYEKIFIKSLEMIEKKINIYKNMSLEYLSDNNYFKEKFLENNIEIVQMLTLHKNNLEYLKNNLENYNIKDIEKTINETYKILKIS